MPTLTVRGVPVTLQGWLHCEARRRGVDVNALTRRLLSDAMFARLTPGTDGRFTDLDALAGTWSADNASRFNAAARPFAQVDAALWK